MLLEADAKCLPLSDNSIQTVVCSPPYFGLRTYGLGPDELGHEEKIADYIKNLIKIFDEVRRVLKKDGTLWVNVGDTANTRAVIRPSAHNGGLKHSNDSINSSWRANAERGKTRVSWKTGSNLKEKDLIGVEARLQIAMQDAGWWLRSKVIWDKNGRGTPDSAKDRPSLNHEYILLFTKSKNYYFEKTKDVWNSVWTISPQTQHPLFKGPAVMPLELAKRCILSSSRESDVVLDPFCGTGVVEHVARQHNRISIGCDLTSQWFYKGANESLSPDYQWQPGDEKVISIA